MTPYYTTRSIPERIEHNERLKCDVPGCPKTRYRVNRYCATHESRYRDTGNPQGRIIRPKEYAYEKARVSELINKNHAHPGIQSALRWLKKWLDDACLGYPVSAQAELQRLQDAGIDPLEILKECCALWLLSKWQPRLLPTDEDLTVMLSVAVFRLAPRKIVRKYIDGTVYRDRAGKRVRREFGNHIRANIGVLILNVCQEVERQEYRQYHWKNDLKTPFPSEPENT